MVHQLGNHRACLGRHKLEWMVWIDGEIAISYDLGYIRHAKHFSMLYTVNLRQLALHGRCPSTAAWLPSANFALCLALNSFDFRPIVVERHHGGFRKGKGVQMGMISFDISTFSAALDSTLKTARASQNVRSWTTSTISCRCLCKIRRLPPNQLTHMSSYLTSAAENSIPKDHHQ